MRLHQHFFLVFRVLLLLISILLLSSCDKYTLPLYWLCEGSSEQVVLSSSGLVLEKYQGKEPLMLEIWGNHIYQFLQGSFSGGYVICHRGKNACRIDFSLNRCEESTGFNRKGILNLNTGELLMKEVRIKGDRIIQNEGQYQCHKTGHTFNFTDFNHAKP